MFKKGDEVVAMKRKDYALTATERSHGYVGGMIDNAIIGKIMVVTEIIGVSYIAGGWIWCAEDLELAEQES